MPDLRALLQTEAKRREPDQHLPFEALVRDQRRRQVRRRVASAALVAVGVAAAALTVPTLTAGGNRQELTTSPSGAPSVTTPPSAGTAGPASPCAAADLTVAASGGGAVSNGSTGATIFLFNTTFRACTLPNHATTVSDLDHSPPVEIPATPLVGAIRGGYLLRPNEYAAFYLSSARISPGEGCSLHEAPAIDSAPHRLALGLPGTGSIIAELPQGQAFTLACWPVLLGSMYTPDASDLPTTWTSAAPANHPAACTTSDLHARQVGGGYGGGSDFGSIVAWNTSNRPCQLEGAVHFAAYYADGTLDRLAVPNRVPATLRAVLPSRMAPYRDGADFGPYLSALLMGPYRDDGAQPNGLCRLQDERTPSILELTIGDVRLRVANYDPNIRDEKGLTKSVYGCHGQILLESVHGPS